jgi:hypothetical protein
MPKFETKIHPCCGMCSFRGVDDFCRTSGWVAWRRVTFLNREIPIYRSGRRGRISDPRLLSPAQPCSALLSPAGPCSSQFCRVQPETPSGGGIKAKTKVSLNRFETLPSQCACACTSITILAVLDSSCSVTVLLAAPPPPTVNTTRLDRVTASRAEQGVLRAHFVRYAGPVWQDTAPESSVTADT